MSAATGKAGFDSAFPPKIEGFPKVPYGDASAVEQAIDERTVAVMVEPVQGEAGVVVPPPGYLRDLRAICDRHGILLIVDEIQTGMARTGPMFAHQAEGVQPDIMTLGKGLGGGLPISAVLATEHAACFQPGDHGGTFSGNALMCSGALAVLDTLSRPAHTQLRRESSLYLEAALSTIARTTQSTLRGGGHLWALVLERPYAELVRDRAFERGLLVNAARPHILRFMPALDVSRDHVDEMARILLDVLTD
jgi:acetylornithine/N-succinyldiaminopimelate aminotransferase